MIRNRKCDPGKHKYRRAYKIQRVNISVYGYRCVECGDLLEETLTPSEDHPK